MRAGTRKGKTQNQVTTTTIRMQTRIFSHLRGRRESGTVRPIETAKDRMTNLARPVVTQQKGLTKYSASLHLANISKAIAKQGRK